MRRSFSAILFGGLAIGLTNIEAMAQIGVDCLDVTFEQWRSRVVASNETCGTFFGPAQFVDFTNGENGRRLYEFEVRVQIAVPSAIAVACTGLKSDDLAAGQLLGMKRVLQFEVFGNDRICVPDQAGPIVQVWQINDPTVATNGLALDPIQVNQILDGYWGYRIAVVGMAPSEVVPTIWRFSATPGTDGGSLTTVGDAFGTIASQTGLYRVLEGNVLQVSIGGDTLMGALSLTTALGDTVLVVGEENDNVTLMRGDQSSWQSQFDRLLTRARTAN